jgi:type VI secretion system protein ImpM
MSNLGVYGKLPAHGDFLFRELSPGFINSWDEWLQLYISASNEQIGEDWVNVSLTSPIWRFVLSPGVIDEHVWAGILMPSVDRVGRYFPFTVLRKLPALASPVGFMFSQQQWFLDVEANALMALDGKISVDEMLASVSTLGPQLSNQYEATSHRGESGDFIIGMPDASEKSIQSCLPSMLDARLAVDFPSYSLWQTEGSERVSPMMFCCQGLPSATGVAAMMDGQWQLRGWKIPFNLNY